MQERLAGTGHAHGQGQQIQEVAVGWVVAADLLEAAHPDVVIEIPGAGHPDNGHQKQIGACRVHGMQGHLELGAVNRMACLKTHHTLPSEFLVRRTGFPGRHAQRLEIEMQRRAKDLQRAANVEVAGFLIDIGDTRVASVG